MQEEEQKEKRKKKKKSNYFNDDTEAAIIAFQNEEDTEQRKKIYVEGVQPSFAKLVENIIFVYKFHTIGNIDALKNDCISFLFENLRKFDGSKGHKAFSYFNVVAKNWFIQRVKTHKKKSRSDVPFDSTVLAALEKDNHQAVVVSYEDQIVQDEYITLLKEEIESWRNRFDKHQERKVLEAVILLLSNPDLISIYNKKGIYLYIREITGLNTKQVVTNLSKLKKKYNLFKKRYYSGEM